MFPCGTLRIIVFAMCGRLALTLPPDSVAHLFDASFANLSNLEPRYNVCPTQSIVACVSGDDGRKIVSFRWGFIPRWYKKPSDGPLLINARSETIAEKPAFRSSARTRRCLIPATGFYEWTKADDGGKDPFYIYPAAAEAFAFAGVWRDWTSPEGDVLSTAAIVTCSANDDISAIHHRMPVIIQPDDFGLWLGEEGKGAATLMQPAPSGTILSYRVSRDVNGSRSDNADLMAPLDE